LFPRSVLPFKSNLLWRKEADCFGFNYEICWILFIRNEKGKKANTLSSDDYFNLMVIDVDDEMTFRMIYTQSTVLGEQILNTEIGKKMQEYINNNNFATDASEKVILRKFNAIYTEFIPYF
jgi:hypothetical protein